MKRPFALKTIQMSQKIPKNALEKEKEKLNLISLWASIYSSDQATLEALIKSAEKQFSSLKKEQYLALATFDSLKVTFQKNPTYYNNVIEKSLIDSHIEQINIPVERYNQVANEVNSKNGNFEEIKKLIPNISETIKGMKGYAKLCRKNKQNYKKGFLKYLVQVNYGLKKEKEYGPIPKVQTTDNCNIIEKWLKLEKSNKITEARRKLINEIKC